MTRRGTGFTIAGGLLLLSALVVAALNRWDEPWMAYQEHYRHLALAKVGSRDNDEATALAKEQTRPHEIRVARFDLVDRCTTCHLGHEPGAMTFAEHPFRGHAGDEREMGEAHPVDRSGCTSCHGGQGRRLDRRGAHDKRIKSGGWSAFTHPRTRCSRCHPQGGKRSPRGDRGAELYFSLGCPGCHQPGRSGPAIGPNLASIGLRGRAYLKQVLLNPDSVYPQTIMPPLRFVMDEGSDDFGALLIHLQSFEPWPRREERRPRYFSPTQCTNCHLVTLGGMPSHEARHSCSYLLAESSWLRCDRCHKASKKQETSRKLVTNEVQHKEASIPVEPSGAVSTPLPRPPRPIAAPLSITNPRGSCPFLEPVMTTCGVCHREGER